jgi:hypothetical protein
MSIISYIKNLYFGKYKFSKTFIPLKDEEMTVEDCITYISQTRIEDYSIIEGLICVLVDYDLSTQEWVFKPLKPESTIEFRFVDISKLNVFPLENLTRQIT